MVRVIIESRLLFIILLALIPLGSSVNDEFIPKWKKIVDFKNSQSATIKTKVSFTTGLISDQLKSSDSLNCNNKSSNLTRYDLSVTLTSHGSKKAEEYNMSAKEIQTPRTHSYELTLLKAKHVALWQLIVESSCHDEIGFMRIEATSGDQPQYKKIAAKAHHVAVDSSPRIRVKDSVFRLKHKLTVFGMPLYLNTKNMSAWSESAVIGFSKDTHFEIYQVPGGPQSPIKLRLKTPIYKDRDTLSSVSGGNEFEPSSDGDVDRKQSQRWRMSIPDPKDGDEVRFDKDYDDRSSLCYVRYSHEVFVGDHNNYNSKNKGELSCTWIFEVVGPKS